MSEPAADQRPAAGAAALPEGNRPLHELASRLTEATTAGDGHRVDVAGITADSHAVRPGYLFVAIPGAQADGHDHVAEARARGASAIVASHAVPEAQGLPVLRVANTRRALAELAAAWYDYPARALRMVGITGTVGKTTVLTMLERIMHEVGTPVGSIGSLGVHAGDALRETGYTAPDPLLLHAGLRAIADAGARLAAMEVTSHALEQERVHGLTYDLGVFTNLVPLEHADYHGSFRTYVRVKTRFFDHLRPDAPIVYSAGDRAVSRLVRRRAQRAIGCGAGPRAAVRIERLAFAADGTRFVLNVRIPLPALDGRVAPPVRLPIAIRLLGRSAAINAALAAAAALCLGAPADALGAALAGVAPPRRRREIVQHSGFLVLDDTIGHPDSVSGLFEVVEQLQARRVHCVFAVRGRRGERINRQTAEALAIWLAHAPPATLVVTRSADVTDARNEVSDAEYDAFTAALRSAGIPFERRDALRDAVEAAADRLAAGDLLLLLGAQGMDRGAEFFRAWANGRARPRHEPSARPP